MTTFSDRREAGLGICAYSGCGEPRVSKWHSYCAKHRREVEARSRGAAPALPSKPASQKNDPIGDILDGMAADLEGGLVGIGPSGAAEIVEVLALMFSGWNKRVSVSREKSAELAEVWRNRNSARRIAHGRFGAPAARRIGYGHSRGER